MEYETILTEINSKWEPVRLDTDFKIELKKGLEILITTKQGNEEKETKNKIIGWNYKIAGNKLYTEIWFKKVGLEWFHNKLVNYSENKMNCIRIWIAIISLILVALIAGFLYSVFNYPEPGFIWSRAGLFLRTSVMLVIIGIAFRIIYKNGGKPSVSPYEIFVCTTTALTAFILGYLWWTYSAPSAEINIDSEPIKYLSYIGDKITATITYYAKIFNGIAIIVSALGFKWFASTMQVADKLFKK